MNFRRINKINIPIIIKIAFISILFVTFINIVETFAQINFINESTPKSMIAENLFCPYLPPSPLKGEEKSPLGDLGAGIKGKKLLKLGKLTWRNGFMNASDSLKKTVVRLNIIKPGLSVEQQISFANTVVADISLSLLTIFDSSQYKYYFYFYPSVKGEYRHYYNFSRRLREGRSINHFSGSYIGIVYFHLFGDKRRPAFDQAGVMWGTQYVSIKRFHIGFNIGFGYSIYSDPRIAPGFSLLGDLKIGYTF